MDFQHLHGFNRPPPPPPLPSMADPHYPPPPPQSQRPPALPPNSWHPSQFQYHPPSQHSPSHPPPPPPPYQWSAPPPPYHAPYPSHHFPQNHYPHPPAARPNLPPPLPQSHHHTNQDLGSTNWGHHQTSDYSAHTKEEDWAAKAREWAAAKAASDNQQPPLTQSGRHEEPNHYYYDRYPQSTDPHFQDSQQERVWTPSYQQFTDSVAAPSQNVPIGHSQKSSYIHHDEHLSYTDRDGSLAGDPTSALPQQGNLSVSPLVHWPEVPSSYSSIGGEEVAGNRQNDRLYNSHSLSVTSGVQHNVKPLPPPPPPPVVPLSTMTEEPHHSYGGHFTEAINLMDKPLEFAPHVNRHHGLHVQSNYSHSDSVGSSNGVDPVSRMTSTYAWPPAAIGVEPAMVVPSPVFGRLPAPNFHSTVPTVNPTFGYSSGAAGITTSVTFPADSYAMSSDRPKKASVPNWLREEIIKKKAVITGSVPDLQRDDDLEDEDVNKPYRRGDQVDTKSIESSRSTEEEDDDEDDVDAARTAAINVEIKRVLTEVLLKVTDELFDEIATKVLSEDSPILEAESDATLTGNKLSSSAHAVSTPKASAKVLIPFKIREDSGDGNKHSASASPGNVLGLANYASDDDDDDNAEIQSNVKTIPDKDSLAQQSVAINQAEGKILVENGSSLDKIEKKGGLSEDVENAMKMSPNSSTTSMDKDGRQPSDDKEAMELVQGNSRLPSKSKSGVLEETLAEEVAVGTEGINRDFDNKKRKLDSSHIRETQNKSDNTSKAKNKDIDNIKDKFDDGDHKRRERYVKNDQTSDDKKDQVKDNKIFKSVEKENEQDMRKKAFVDTTESKGKTDRESRSSGKCDNTRRTEKGKDEKREKSRRRGESDSGKHRRRRSSSTGSRGRENKDNLVSYPTDSNDESSDDYKRKPYSRRRRSPSPIRARKRQVSRSPRSKHSHQRRHSPYPSLETSRSRRSRSRSPIRRKR